MAKYLITGASGYIGSMLVKNLYKYDSNCQIVALIRNKNNLDCDFDLRYTKIIQSPLSNLLELKEEIGTIDNIIHCASITKSSKMVETPVEVIESIVNTTQDVMEYARKIKVKNVLFISSMEVYGNLECADGHRANEDEIGKVDILNARSCYPLGKQMAENICFSYFKQYDVPIKIARLSQTFGKGIKKTDTRVFMQFAKSAKYLKDIVLHTKGESMGNYCSIDDTISGIVKILENGEYGQAYNIVNEENTMTVKQMAEMVAQDISKGKIKVIYDIPSENIYGYAKKTSLRMSSEKLRNLGWCPKKTLKQMYMDLLEEI